MAPPAELAESGKAKAMSRAIANCLCRFVGFMILNVLKPSQKEFHLLFSQRLLSYEAQDLDARRKHASIF